MIPDEFSTFDSEQIQFDSELQRHQTLLSLGLLEPGSVPIFEEATQTAAHFLNAPICVLSLLDRDRVWFKSAVGLSRIGLMNSLASSRQLSRQEAFCARVVEAQRVLLVADAPADPVFARMQLVQRYGIRSYLGVPLLAANGQCLGTLAVMGLAPRTFSEQEMAFLELMARWSMSEFERNWLQQSQHQSRLSAAISASAASAGAVSAGAAQPTTATSSAKISLLTQMTQELCTPLTSILGMAKVLSQGIYGSLSEKQQEYIQIIHNSGQYLLALVNEIVELGALDDQSDSLNLNPIDIEMLCQQVISSLEQVAQRQNQTMQLTVEPGNRVWLLDKDKVRQMLYHLVFNVIQSASSDSMIRIHVSRKQTALHLSVWSSHPWLGEGLPQIAPPKPQAVLSSQWAVERNRTALSTLEQPDQTSATEIELNVPSSFDARQSLGLMLSRHLAELHTGDIIMQGSSEEGFRYVIRLPQIKSSTEG